MSKKLAPFSVVLINPSPHITFPPRITDKIRRKMDIATNPVLKSFMAGSLSGTCSTILFQPLDLIKTRIQQSSSFALQVSANPTSPIPTAAATTATKATPSMISVVCQVLRTEHVSGLWRGITPSLTRTVPGVGIYFGSLHMLKNNLHIDDCSPLQNLFVGITARCIAGTATIPITVVKMRFESGIYGYQRITTALFSIYAKEGVRGLCCGLVPTLVRDAPYSGLYYTFYTLLEKKVAPDEKSHVILFSCKLSAGFLASLITHPADVVKTRMQIRPDLYRSVFVVSVAIFKEAGIAGFLRGLAPRMLRKTLMSALTWTVYEQVMKQLGLK